MRMIIGTKKSCEPCKAWVRDMMRLCSSENVMFETYDVEEDVELCEAHEVNMTPHTRLMDNGRTIEVWEGAGRIPMEEIEEVISRS